MSGNAVRSEAKPERGEITGNAKSCSLVPQMTYHFAVTQKQLEEESSANAHIRRYFLEKGKKNGIKTEGKKNRKKKDVLCLCVMPFSCPLSGWSSRQNTKYSPSECILSLHDDVIVRNF